MIENQLQEILALVNRQTKLQEELTGQLIKANALAEITLSENFLEQSKATLHGQLWALSDVIERAKDLNEQALDALMKYTRTNVVNGHQREGSQSSNKTTTIR